MTTIEVWSAEAAAGRIADLSALLIDCIAHGAAVGFLPPLSVEAATHYWEGVIAELLAGTKYLLVARNGDELLGSAQLALAGQPNGRHRAEVQKVLVDTRARRRGVATALMAALDALALRTGRTLLVLDTRQGEPSEQLYQKCGYTVSGVIPGYARSADGTMHTTVIYYRQLSAPPE